MRPKKDAGFFQGIKALRVLLNEWNWRVFGFLCVPRYTYVSKCRRRRVRYAFVSVNFYFWQDAYKKWRITPEFDFRRAFRLACVLVKTQEKCLEENRSCCSKIESPPFSNAVFKLCMQKSLPKRGGGISEAGGFTVLFSIKEPLQQPFYCHIYPPLATTMAKRDPSVGRLRAPKLSGPDFFRWYHYIPSCSALQTRPPV